MNTFGHLGICVDIAILTLISLRIASNGEVASPRISAGYLGSSRYLSESRETWLPWLQHAVTPKAVWGCKRVCGVEPGKRTHSFPLHGARQLFTEHRGSESGRSGMEAFRLLAEKF
ncbi:hypothetical protein AOLI_G00020030 [Acnodon oligacanthus]